MISINENFLKISGSYLFAQIADMVKTCKQKDPSAQIISLGIGDVTMPLCDAVIEAMHTAVNELASKQTFHGYGPEHGYDFLIEEIIKNDFIPRGVKLDNTEIFISDGAKSDTGNIGDILGNDNIVAVTDPVYPVYVDSNAMSGRGGENINGVWSKIVYLPCKPENNFVPQLPHQKVDIVYLCCPNNPTGTVLTRSDLEKWVDYALKNHVLIMYDAAYEAFIRDCDTPHSIYEINGAEQTAIEFRSFSKTAGFTGVRCGYTVVPQALIVKSASGKDVSLNKLWTRRQCTKFNGASYIAQCGAKAVYSAQGKIQTRAAVDYYLENAAYLKSELKNIGFKVYGGENAPYLWVATPDNMLSFDFFNLLLDKAHLVCTPGSGFGASGEGFVRFTAFGTRESYVEAVKRLKSIF